MSERAAPAGVLGALSVALATPLLWPVLGEDAGGEALRPVRAVLVDASASAVRRRPGHVAWVRERLRAEAAEAAAAGEEVALVVFAEGVERPFGPGPPGELADWIAGRGRPPLVPTAGGADGETLLAEAVALAAPWVAAPPRASTREPGRVHVLGDGGFTGADPDPRLSALAAAGAGVRWSPPGPPERPDGAVLDLAVPPRAEEGAPLAARATVWLSPGAGGGGGAGEVALSLEAEVEDAAGARRVVRERALVLPRGAEPATARVTLDLGAARAGLARVRVRARADGDPIPENDERAGTVRVAGRRVLALVADEGAAGRASSFLEGLPGLQVVPMSAAELSGRVDEVDAVVSFEVPARALPARVLERFVRAGGGWLRVEGWSFLQPAPAELDVLSPLVPHPGEDEERDVLFLVDGSGSMAGEPFEAVRAAALELVLSVRPRDAVALRFFTSGLHPERVLRERGAGGDPSELAAALLDLRVPRGPTRILHSLEQLAGERAEGSREELVLLLTDGREDAGALRSPERFDALRGSLAGTRTELAVIAVGPEADLAFLERLAREGRRVHRADDLAALEDVFQERVHGDRVRAGDALQVRWAPGSRFAPREGTAREGTAGEASPGEAAPGPPPIRRRARAVARADAEPVLVAEDGEPILAAGRAGAGRVAAWVSPPVPGWAPAWAEAAPLLAPVLRHLARRPDEPLPRARTDGRRLVVEGLGGAAAARGAAAIAGVPPGGALAAAPPEEELFRVVLAPRSSPGGVHLAGELEAPLAPAEARLLRPGGPGHALLLDVPAGEEGPSGAAPVPIESAPAPEFLPPAAPGAAPRSAMAEARRDPERAPAPRAEEPHPLGPWLLGLGLVLIGAWALAPAGRRAAAPGGPAAGRAARGGASRDQGIARAGR